HAGRERLLLDLLQFLLHLLNDIGSVGAGALLENDGCGRVAVDVGVDVKELGAEFNAVAVLGAFGLVPMSTWSRWRPVFAVGTAGLRALRRLVVRGVADVLEPQDFTVRVGP